jgi:hypothetical protein
VAVLLKSVTVRGDWINLTGAETAPNIAETTVFDDRVEVAESLGELRVRVVSLLCLSGFIAFAGWRL